MAKHTYDDLCSIMKRLRSDNGCPWDRKQTHDSLKVNILEEVYELVDAIDKSDASGMCEELGDVLMLTVFHGLLAEEAGNFTNSDVVDGICRKMITRHSHVFGADSASTPEDALDTWNKNKAIEKAYSGAADKLKGVPRTMSSLLRAQRVQSRANVTTSEDSLREELACAVESLLSMDMRDQQAAFAQIGSVLWLMIGFSRLFEINADFALTNAIETFINRFEADEIDKN